MTIADKTIDRRVLERNIRKGLVTEKEVSAYLASLPDREGEFEKIEMEGMSDASVANND
jgi:hypothetical protein